jgi:hypothetical protein
MAVITIPSDQDPRVPSFHCVDGPYIFDAANFPPTLGLKDEKHDSDHVANDEKSRSWAGVVEFGPLEVVESGKCCSKMKTDLEANTRTALQDMDLEDEVEVEVEAEAESGKCGSTMKTNPEADTRKVSQDAILEDEVEVEAEVEPTPLAPSPTFHDFFKLSREIRLVIWDLAVRDQPYTSPAGREVSYLNSTINLREYVKKKDNSFRPGFLPDICRVSKSTMEEAIAVVIEGSTFMVASIFDNIFFQKFLQAAPGRLRLCRRINFDYFGRFPDKFDKNADLELAA